MRTFAALLGILAWPGQAEDFVDNIIFEPPATESELARVGREEVCRRETWLEAYRAIESRLGAMPRRMRLTVKFDWTGPEFAKAAAQNGQGWIRFNPARLEEHVRRMREIEAEKARVARSGGTLVFRVPPVRLDRVVWHELTHVFQSNYSAPEWFNEGMAQWLSEDLNCLSAFVQSGRGVRAIERLGSDRVDLYARGHLFWSWLDSRNVLRLVAQSVVDRRPWRAALEDATGLSWDSIVATEREWSEQEVDRLRKIQK